MEAKSDVEFGSPTWAFGPQGRSLRVELISEEEAASWHRHREAAGIGVPTGHRRQDQKGRRPDRQGDRGGGITVGG
jgi:hypothetical protein